MGCHQDNGGQSFSPIKDQVSNSYQRVQRQKHQLEQMVLQEYPVYGLSFLTNYYYIFLHSMMWLQFHQDHL